MLRHQLPPPISFILLIILTIYSLPAGAATFTVTNLDDSGASSLDAFIAINRSYATTCAEEDNINVPMYADAVPNFELRATHPAYNLLPDNCAADFSGCPSSFRTTLSPLHGNSLSCQNILTMASTALPSAPTQPGGGHLP